MAYTIEQFLSLRTRVHDLRARRDALAPQSAAEESAALESQLRESQGLLTAIAISPEGEEESSDCFTWGLEALMEDDTERALGFLDISLALDLEHFRHDGVGVTSVRHTGTLMGKIYVREQRPDKAAYCFEAVLETIPKDASAVLPSHVVEAAVRLANVESGRGNEADANELVLLAYGGGREAENPESRGFAAWAAVLLAEQAIAKGRMDEAKMLSEEAVRLAATAEGREGMLAGAQAALKILAGQFGDLDRASARRFADQGVVLAGKAAESGQPYARQIHCFALAGRANLHADLEDWEGAESDLRELLDQCEGIPNEEAVRSLGASILRRFPPGWFEADEDDDE